jgi:hypothetical protein
MAAIIYLSDLKTGPPVDERHRSGLRFFSRDGRYEVSAV